MNNRKNNCRSAAALQLALAVVLLFIVAIMIAPTFKAASVGAQQTTATTQSGFYPPLPVPATSDHNPGSLAPNGEPSCTPQEVSDKLENNDPKQQGALVPSGVPS